MSMNLLMMILFDPDTYVWMIVGGVVFFSIVVFLVCRRSHRRWFRLMGLALVLACWCVSIDGLYWGISQVNVRQVEFASKDLPAAFDGYRIVQFSDVHIGTFTGWRRPILDRVIDSINAQHADLIVFTGDLQNKVPEEIEPHVPALKRLKAKDGICSVLGNHDYADYTNLDDVEKSINVGKTCDAEYELGWYLLTNGYHRIRRGQDNIVISGMENDGEGRFPQLGNIASALIGLNRQSFVVMLEHDPTSWRRKILPHSHCQLTLSGHTHGGQFSLLGLTPAMFSYRESGGMYYIGERAMNVSTGVGGIIPFRFGVPPEIVVITLRKK